MKRLGVILAFGLCGCVQTTPAPPVDTVYEKKLYESPDGAVVYSSTVRGSDGYRSRRTWVSHPDGRQRSSGGR